LGYLIPQKKVERMNLPSFFQFSESQGFPFKVIDFDLPLEKQGPFDLIIIKVLSEIVENDPRLAEYHTYFKNHPKMILVDSIEAQKSTLDRDSMSSLLSKVQDDLPKEMKVRNPRHLHVDKEAAVYDTSKFSFPVVCKTNLAGGIDTAHKMGLVFNEKGLHDFPPPFVAQEFFNHNGAVFKIFVIGDYIYSVKRKSIPNVGEGGDETLFFDSQHPLAAQLEKLKKLDSSKSDQELFDETPDVPKAVLQSISKGITKRFGLTLFGFDVLHSVTGEYGVIDVNYFPGYIGVENFNQKLFDYIKSRIPK